MTGGEFMNPPVDDFDVDSSAIPSTEAPKDIRVIVEDDTPEKDRGRPRRKEGHQPYDITDDEIAKYDDSVKGRIQKLRFEYHEERRLKEEAARRELAAIEYGRKLVAENARLNNILQQGEKTLIEIAKQKTQSSIMQAKRDLAEAHAAGDAERIAEATAEISKYSSEAEALNYQTPTNPQKLPTPEEATRAYQQQVLSNNRPQPHAKAVAWYNENKDWFDTDPIMQKYAMYLDGELIKRGSSPATDDHYEYIDRELRRAFPDRFGQADSSQEATVQMQPTQTQQPRQSARVAPVMRTGNMQTQQRIPTQVRLTKSEVSIARKLGLTPEQYAEQKMKDYPNG